MLWLNEYTDRIRSHLAAGDQASLTYAALEARLAIERLCYERLRVAHRYISSADLRTWKPQYVVQTVMEMVDSNIASEWTLQISSQPGDKSSEFLPVGTQKGFSPKYINQLWQAMSSFLRCEMPKDTKRPVAHYKQENSLRQKIEETLRELDRIAEGTMIGALVLEQVSFSCACGQANHCARAALRQDDLINCIRESCTEQYRVEIADDEYSFERRSQIVKCHKCSSVERLPYRKIHELKTDERAWFFCRECGEENTFMWRLMQVKRNSP